MISQTTALRDKLERNTLYFREGITKTGFQVRPGVHPIVPIMLYEAKIAQEMAALVRALAPGDATADHVGTEAPAG